MKKYILLVLFGLVLVALEVLVADYIPFHQYYQLTVIFFVAQVGVLFRISDFRNEELKAQLTIVSITLRLLSAMTFALVMNYRIEDGAKIFFIQFIILYLLFMTFEIIMSLANLRQN